MNEQTPDHIQNLNDRIMEVIHTLLHDINNAAFAADANLAFVDRLLGLQVLDRRELQKYVKAATNASGHMIDLVKYAQSALRHGQADYNPKPTNIVECIDTASDMYSIILAEQNIHLARPRMRDDQARERLYFAGDKTRLVQVLMNIFSNSARAMQKQADKDIILSIETILSGEQDTAVLTVKNNGPKMPYADPNEAKEKGKTTREGSHGLGLYICTDIIENKFCGKFDITHPAEGGVAFHVHLRLLNPAEIRQYKESALAQPYHP